MKARTYLAVVIVVGGLMSLLYGFAIQGALSGVLGMMWLLVSLVAFIGREVLGALIAPGAGDERTDRGGADVPSWMKGK